jgi:hypothetical protein
MPLNFIKTILLRCCLHYWKISQNFNEINCWSRLLTCFFHPNWIYFTILLRTRPIDVVSFSFPGITQFKNLIIMDGWTSYLLKCRVSKKKIKKLIKSGKSENKWLKKSNRKKKQLNQLEFLQNQLVRFWFYKFETEKTEPNPNRKKIEPNWKNWFELVFVLK